MSTLFPPDPTQSEQPTSASRGRGRRWAFRGIAVVVALIAVAVASSAIYVGSVSKSFTNNVQRENLLPGHASGSASPGRQAESDGSKPRSAGNTAALNYVLMGSDSRNVSDVGAGRSDSLMVMHLSADRKAAYLISFPRDIYVSIPGYGKNKINAAYSFGGPQLAAATLEDLLHTRMDHVAILDFDGFILLTEELGGVTVMNEHASKSRGYTFPAGEITIKGEEALVYVRERYALPNGDLDRAERQRLVVKAIMGKGLSPETIRNPARFTGFVSGVAKHMVVDEGLTNHEIRRTALSLRLTANDLHLLQAPISGFGTVNGASIDVVDQARMTELAKAMRGDTMDDYLQRYPRS
jgi:LCP family protein required for cell wall assembly